MQGANSPSADTLYADGLRRLRCLQPGSDTSTSSNPPTTCSGSGGSGTPSTGGGLDVERTASSWNFLAGMTSFTGSKTRKARSPRKDASTEGVPPAPPLQSIPSARLINLDNNSGGLQPGGGSGTPVAAASGTPTSRASSGTLTELQPKTRRHEAQGKTIRWAPGVTSRNGRLAKSDSLASISSDRPACSGSLS